MKIKKEALMGLLIIAVIAAVAAVSYTWTKVKNRNTLAGALAELSPRGGPPETIEGLRQAIALYEEELDRYVKTAAQTGVYWKILASRLQDKGLHVEALDALERAIRYHPDDAALLYMTGVSAAVAAKSSLDFGGSRENENRTRYYLLAESAYLQAIALDGAYARPCYGLGVLYVFEMNRPAEAIPYLQRVLELRGNDTDALFVLARAYYMTGQRQEALDVYGRIISFTRDKIKKAEAENNRRFIMDDMNG
ncbi:MAG: tetratricopeptide repeat protein [Treponema sp.]|jgi:tetratricopeptide (TPR) repeat protein|nr:tetratricopeptide repeat protein [Treponema sp.]